MTTKTLLTPSNFPIVIIESPYAGDVLANEEYARKAMYDCLMRGEAPYASHLLYTQEHVLDDTVPKERDLGIDAGFAFHNVAYKTVVYWDRGISVGMKYGIDNARTHGCPIEYRSLEGRKRCYLAGPMEYTEDNGLGWRLEYRAALQFLGVKCIIPSEEEENLLVGRDMKTLKKTDIEKHNKLMREFIAIDLAFVETVDFIVTRWEGERMSGTFHEAGHAYQIGKPCYLVTSKPNEEVPGWFLACFTKTFNNMNQLVSYLREHK